MRTIHMLLAALLLGISPLAAQNAVSEEPVISACTATEQRVHEDTFLSIGGIDQWVTMRGANCANPVLLFLHGGPGNPLSPYADSIFGAWESEFTLVHWDQRGAGRTFSRNPDTKQSELTIEKMTQDGIELASYLITRFGKRKIILIGGSWGSVLGVHMVKSRPDLFHAYIGVAQLVNYRQNQIASYEAVLDSARKAGDESTLSTIESLGPPPWSNPRNLGVLRRATRKYEAGTSTPAPDSWWVASSEYATPEMQAAYEAGEDYSYLQFVGLDGDGMFSRVDLPALGTTFDLPLFLVQGTQDLVTTPEVTKGYFDTIEAPRKEYIIISRTGHDFNAAVVDALYAILMEDIRPLTQ